MSSMRADLRPVGRTLRQAVGVVGVAVALEAHAGVAFCACGAPHALAGAGRGLAARVEVADGGAGVGARERSAVAVGEAFLARSTDRRGGCASWGVGRAGALLGI